MMNRALRFPIVAQAVLMLALWLCPSRAEARLPEFDLYKPLGLAERFVAGLPASGLAALPDNTPAPPGLERFAFRIVRGALAVGYTEYVRDLVAGWSQFRVTDVLGQELLVARWENFPCAQRRSAGLCENIVLSTTREPPAGNDFAFTITDSPGWGIEYFRYGRPTNVTIWRAEHRDSFSWLRAVLVTTNVVIPFQFSTPLEAVHYQLAIDPLVSPWLHSFRLVESAGRTILVVGRVPSNAVHDIIVTTLIRAGIYGIRDQLVIDTGLGRGASPLPLWP